MTIEELYDSNQMAIECIFARFQDNIITGDQWIEWKILERRIKNQRIINFYKTVMSSFE